MRDISHGIYEYCDRGDSDCVKYPESLVLKLLKLCYEISVSQLIAGMYTFVC